MNSHHLLRPLAMVVMMLILGLSERTVAADTTITGQVEANALAYFVISLPPSGVAGQPFTATITAKQADGATTTNVTVDVTLSTTNGGTITPLTIPKEEFTDDGVWTGSITLTRAGLGRVVRAVSGTASGEATLTIEAGPLERVEVTPSTATVETGEEVQFTATAFDAFDNVITGLVFTWSVVNGGGNIDADGTFTAGQDAGTFADTVRASTSQGAIERSDTATVVVTAPPSIIERIIDTIGRLRERLRDNPVITKIGPIFNPIATTTATISFLTQLLTTTPALVNLSDLLLYTSYLWSVLLEFLGLKRRRKAWGVVYNAQTKEPLPLVVVQLIDVATAQMVERRVTDPYGRYGFLVKPGRYRIMPTHPHFSFPSKISPHKGDLRYSDLYHGEEINIADQETVVAYNIPLDPLAKEAVKPSLFPRLSFRRLSFALLVLSVLLQGFTIFVHPTPLNFVLFTFYFGTLIIIGFVLRRRQRTWGMVYDTATKRELAQAVVFVTQEEDPRFTSRRQTDEYGRFYLLLPRGTYHLTVQHPHYRFPAPPEALGYKGEPLPVSPKNPLIHVDIPVEPLPVEDRPTGG